MQGKDLTAKVGYFVCVQLRYLGYNMSWICIEKGSDGTNHAGDCTVFIVSLLLIPMQM